MKKKKPDLNELILKLVNHIEQTNGTKISMTGVEMLQQKWKGSESQLKSMLKNMDHKTFRVKSELEKTEYTPVEFQIGVSISGTPIVVTHLVERRKYFKRHDEAPIKFTVQARTFTSNCTF